MNNSNINAQLSLPMFVDFDFKSTASARTHYGNAAESIVCEALELAPISIDGRCTTNFDALSQQGTYWEIKSVRQGGSVPLYQMRIDKEREFMRNEGKLMYAFCVHTVKNAKSNYDLWRQLSYGVKIIVAQPNIVHSLAHTGILRKIKSDKGAGYTRKGYDQGYYNVAIKYLNQEQRPGFVVTINGFKIPVSIAY